MPHPVPKIVQTQIDRLYEDSQSQGFLSVAKKMFRWPPGPLRPEDLKDHYLAISPEQGQYLVSLIADRGLRRAIEFGTSFGISTLYLAAGMRITGGKIVTSELIPEKAVTATKNFEAAGVSDLIELRTGDAMETLAGEDSPFDLLLLDGWKDLYLPLLLMLESRLIPGGVVYVDNAYMRGVRPTLDYLAGCELYSYTLLQGGKAALAIRRASAPATDPSSLEGDHHV